VTPPARALLAAAFAAARDAVDPARRLPGLLPPPDGQPTRVIAAGKAAAAQFAAFAAAWTAPVRALVVVPHGTPLPAAVWPDVVAMTAGHPLPDEASLAAGARALALASTTPPDGRLVVLLSGGASALLEALPPGLTLADLQVLNRRLLAAGVPIGAVNGLRRKLSLVKGGRLAAACTGAELWLFALSDVPGDRLADIGSGPCAPDPVPLAAARDLAAHLGAGVPPAVLARLADPAAAPLPPDAPAFRAVRGALLGCPADARAAAAAVLARAGFAVTDLGEASGDALALAAATAGPVAAAVAAGERRAFVSGGEATVLVRNPAGRGGRNTAWLLALALALPAGTPVVAFAADTDGRDGTGPHAGAVLDPGTLARARAAGIDPAAAQAADDSAACFAAAGDLVTTGPTGTNVNDLRIVLTGHPEPGAVG
jgi:hydroxypyruvate reductase